MKVTTEEKQQIQERYSELRKAGLGKTEAREQVAHEFDRGKTTVYDNTYELEQTVEQEEVEKMESESRFAKELARVTVARSIKTRENNVYKKLAAELSAQLDALTEEFDSPLESIFDTDVGLTGEGGNVTVVLAASDWHVGERVDPNQVNGLNRYTPEIATESARLFFTKAMEKILALPYGVDRLILHLGGDFITGDIHQVMRDTNHLTSEEEMVLAYDLIVDGMEYLESSLPGVELQCVTTIGNHGRTTKDFYDTDAYKYNREYVMYYQIARTLRDSNWEFDVCKGYDAYAYVYGRTIRFSHGNYVRGLGAVDNYIVNANQLRKADFDIMGHWHRFTNTDTYQINGSLIGYNGYAKMLGFKPEKANQAMLVFDNSGCTEVHKIIVDSGDRV